MLALADLQFKITRSRPSLELELGNSSRLVGLRALDVYLLNMGARQSNVYRHRRERERVQLPFLIGL